VLLYLATLRFGFVDWDDDRHLVRNPNLNPVSWSGLARVWREPYDRLYIPASYTVFAAEAWLSQRVSPNGELSPVVFHAGNVLMHTANVLLVFYLLHRLVESDTAAMLGALLFAVHPLQVESVAWVSETRGLLATLLSLAALHGYISFITNSPAFKARAYTLATFAFILALLAKPSAVAVPLMTLSLDRFWFGRSWSVVLRSLAPWLTLAVVDAVGTSLLQSSDAPEYITPILERPLVAGDALAFYLGKLVAPVGLAFDYGRTPQVVLASWWGWLAWLVPAQIVVLLALVERRSRWLAVVGFTLAALLPNLGLVPFLFQQTSTVADRYMYLPMVGVALGVAVAIDALRSAANFAAAAVAVVGVAIGVCAAITHQQCEVWRDSESLFAHGLKLNPASVIAHYNLAAYLQRQGRVYEADAEYRKAIELNPKYAWAHKGLGTLLAEQGRFAEAIRSYREAIRLRPNDADAHTNLANALATQGDLAGALREYETAVSLDTQSSIAHMNYGESLIDADRIPQGLEHLAKAVTLSPRSAEAHLKLGVALARLGQTTEARDAFREVIRWNPRMPEGHLNLGLTFLQTGDPAAAEREIDEAIKLAPNHADANFYKGSLLADRGENDRAAAHLRKALRMGSRNPQLISLARERLKSIDPTGAEVKTGAKSSPSNETP
jgi:tetratricopeptide (TPR) repeat protein